MTTCTATYRDDLVTRQCQLPAGHSGEHESWATGPNVLAGVIWP